MSLFWRIPAMVLATLAISCSGPQSTEIVPKTDGGGDNPGPDFPNKPSKSKHDSLGQLSLAAADFVEMEAIMESLLRQDLNENSHPQACPRRRLEGQNDTKTRWYFSLNWSKCGKSFVKKGFDCAAVTTGSPGNLTFDAITRVEINPVADPVPVRDCAKSRFYVSESTTVFSDSGLTMEKVAKSERSARLPVPQGPAACLPEREVQPGSESNHQVSGRCFDSPFPPGKNSVFNRQQQQAGNRAHRIPCQVYLL